MLRLLLLGLLTSSAALASPETAASETPPSAERLCAWTVSGHIQTENELPELAAAFGEFSDLEGITVRVRAMLRLSTFPTTVWGTWDTWEETTTNSRGEFTVRHTPTLNPCDGTRRIRVEVKFQNDDLEIRHGNATSSTTKVKWVTIYDTPEDDPLTDHTLDISRTFGPGRVQELDEVEPRAHANMWVVYSHLLDRLASYGSAYKFTGQLKVKYPHNSLLVDDDANVEASYANPATKVVYIYKSSACPENRLLPAEQDGGCENHLDVSTLLHEAMHIWAYQHSSGEEDLALNLLTTGSTHCFEPTHIAFHEGFAEWAAERFGNLLFDMDSPRPVTRDALRNGFICEGKSSPDRMPTLDKVEEHDYGWITALRTLHKDDLHRYTFAGTTTNREFNLYGSENGNTDGTVNEIQKTAPIRPNCDSPDAGVKDVLTTFLASPTHGYMSPLRKADMNLEDFVERFTDVNDLGNETRDAFLTLIDPAAEEQPVDLFCEGPNRRADLQVETAPVEPQRRSIPGRRGN